MDNLERTIQAIKDLDKKPSVKEWNRTAKEYNFLSSITLKRLYNKDFEALCKEIRDS